MQIFNDFPLSEILYYKIGGVARCVLKIQTLTDVSEALHYVKSNNIKRVLPIGIGSNLLLNDEPFEGAILWFSKSESVTPQLISSVGDIEVFAANLLDDLIQFSFENNFIGLEWAGGLPSTIGGAIRGNVGAFGGEIKKSLISAQVLDIGSDSLEIKTLMNEELQFSYRNSLLKQNKNLIVVSGLFQLQPAFQEELEKAKQEYFSHIQYRKDHHDMSYPSCGSVFKNIVEKEKVAKILEKWPDINDKVTNNWHGKVAMGYVIKRLGLSGFAVGGAQVSEKHANYVINKNNAKFTDVITIIKEVQKRVEAEFGFTPEPEVEIVE